MRFHKFWALILIICLLASCGQTDVNIQVIDPVEATALFNQQATQTPNSNNLIYYEQPQTGIYFHYPVNWQVQEGEGKIVISGDNLRLNIETVLQDSELSPVLSGDENDANLIDSGTVQSLGTSRPVVADAASRRLHYTSPEFAESDHNITFMPMMLSNIGIAIYLDADTWPLSNEQRSTADTIVESIGFTWLITAASESDISHWIHYQDSNSGLSFDYPPEWDIVETADTIEISNSEIMLTLIFAGNPSGLAAGDLRKGEPSHVLINGQAIPRVHLILDNAIKEVYYGQPGTQLEIGNIHFIAIVSDASLQAYESVNLSPDLLRQIDWIMASMHP